MNSILSVLSIAVRSTISCGVLLAPQFLDAQHFNQTNLVSNIAGQASYTDPNLQNAWGIAAGNAGHWWLSDENNGLTTLYDGFGCFSNIPIQAFVVPPAAGGKVGSPTGQVFNGSTTDFLLAPGFPSKFIFATFDGTISGWNPNYPNNGSSLAILEVDNSKAGAIYTGITIAVVNGNKYLLVANFHSGQVEIYDTTFKRVQFAVASSASNPFSLNGSLNTLVPFNIHAVGSTVYVTYAYKNAAGQLVTGPGQGLVAMFTADGILVRIFASQNLNAPWGVSQAGVYFGQFSHALLIANHGDGTVAGFSAETGASLGPMLNPAGAALAIPGLFGLEFGDDTFVPNQPCAVAGSGPATLLYFTANGINGSLQAVNGLFGTLTPIASELAGADIF